MYCLRVSHFAAFCSPSISLYPTSTNKGATTFVPPALFFSFSPSNEKKFLLKKKRHRGESERGKHGSVKSADSHRIASLVRSVGSNLSPKLIVQICSSLACATPPISPQASSVENTRQMQVRRNKSRSGTHIALQIKRKHAVMFCVTAHPSRHCSPSLAFLTRKSNPPVWRGSPACCFGFCVDTVTTLWPAPAVQVVFPLRHWFCK